MSTDRLPLDGADEEAETRSTLEYNQTSAYAGEVVGAVQHDRGSPGGLIDASLTAEQRSYRLAMHPWPSIVVSPDYRGVFEDVAHYWDAERRQWRKLKETA